MGTLMRFTGVKLSKRPTSEEGSGVSKSILKVEGIHTFIGQHHILQGVSFDTEADAVTVLIGRNGAGKSTTLRTIMGLLPPIDGKILFKNEGIQAKSPMRLPAWGSAMSPKIWGFLRI